MEAKLRGRSAETCIYGAALVATTVSGGRGVCESLARPSVPHIENLGSRVEEIGELKHYQLAS